MVRKVTEESCILTVSIVTLEKKVSARSSTASVSKHRIHRRTSSQIKTSHKSWRRYRRRGSSRKINSIRPRKLHRNIGINIRQPRHRPRPRPAVALMLTLSSTRQPLKQQDPRRVRDVPANTRSNADGSGVAGPRAPGVSCRVPHGVPAHARADGGDCESATAAAGGGVFVFGGCGFFKAEDNFDCFFVFDDFRVSGKRDVSLVGVDGRGGWVVVVYLLAK
jgi:hypothetical protein